MSKPRSAINLISLIVKSIKPNHISLQSWLTVEVGAQLDLPARRELRNLTNNQPTDQTRKKATNLYKMGKFLLITPLAILFLFNISATAEYCRVHCEDIRSSYTCSKKDDQCTTEEEWNRRKYLIMALLNSFRNEVFLINNDEDFACELHCHNKGKKWGGCKVNCCCKDIWSSDSCYKRKNDQCTTNEEWTRRKELITAHLNSFRNAAFLVNNAHDKDFDCKLWCH